MTPVKRSPQGKRNKNVDDKIPKDKPTAQTKENNKTEEEEKMETEPSDKNNNNKVLLTYDGISITKKDKDTLKEGEFISDSIISFTSALYESNNKQKMCNSGIVLVRPMIAHMLKNSDRPTARQLM